MAFIVKLNLLLLLALSSYNSTMAKQDLTLDELKANPSKLKDMTLPQLVSLAEVILPMVKGKGSKANIPGNPADFAVKFSGGKWKAVRHLQSLSSMLTASEAGKCSRLLVACPPRHGKSEMISYWFPLWLLSRDPTRKIILCSYEAEFAAQWGRRVRNAIADQGEEFGLVLAEGSTAAHRWELTAGGGMQTAGAGGPITGKGAHFLLIDDPIKNAEEANSEIQREALWDWFKTTAYTRLEPGGVCIIIQTRWHQDDLMGRLEAQTRDARLRASEGNPDPDDILWEIFKLPALAEKADPIGRDIEEPLWPERFPYSELTKIRKQLGPYAWSALYQQRPSPEEGNAVKRSWWKFYEHPPVEYDMMIQSWDLAMKDGKENDFTVGQIWGKKGPDFYLVDQIRDRMNMVEIIAAMRSFTSRYPKAIAKLVEDKASGPALIQLMQKEVYGLIPIKVHKSKMNRLQTVIPLIEGGNVYLPHESRAPWVWDFVEEAAQFPNAANDDQVDCFSQALIYLQPRAWSEASRDWAEAKRYTPPMNPIEIESRWFSGFIKKSIAKANKNARGMGPTRKL